MKSLEVNYRSQRNIIEFNNAFFQTAASITSDQAIEELDAQGAEATTKAEAADIKNAYNDVVQKVPPKRENAGLVDIRLLPTDNYDEQMILQVKEIVEQLMEQGTPPGKIAILARKNKIISRLAEWFQQNPIMVNGQEVMAPMVSDEAFRLDASLAVNTIVTAMYVLVNPTDMLAMAALVKAYRKVCLGNEEATDTELFVGTDDLRTLLPTDMVDHWDEFLSMPIIDLAERLYQTFNLARIEGQSAYMCAFFDQLSKYLQRHVASISDFLTEWDNILCAKSIHSDERMAFAF